MIRFVVSGESDWDIVAALTRKMSSLEHFFIATIHYLSHSKYHRRPFSFRAPLTFISCCPNSEIDWKDWKDLITHSKDTLQTLELEGVRGLSITQLTTALSAVAPTLRRLFFGSRDMSCEATLAAVLPSFKSLISFRTSMSSSAAQYRLLDIIPSTVVELGVSHRSLYYQMVDSEVVIFKSVLENARRLPKLKILWLDCGNNDEAPAFMWRYPEGILELTEAGKAKAADLQAAVLAKGFEWTVLPFYCALPLYGAIDEL